MYARVAWGRLKPDSWPEYEDNYTGLLVPIAEDLPGLRHRTFLRGVGYPDEVLSLSVWDTLEQLRHHHEGADYRRSAAPLQQLLRPNWWSKEYEVRFDR